MLKEKSENLILSYLGRPPKLFDNNAIKNISDILLDSENTFSWITVFALLEKHRLTQVAYINLKTYADINNSHESGRLMPIDFVNQLRNIYLSNAVRNEFLAKELCDVNRLLGDNDIDVINWKGVALAVAAYGDLSLRRFNDIDIWIKANDVKKTRNILLCNGFSDYIQFIGKSTDTGDDRGAFFHSNKKYMLEFDCYMYSAKEQIEYNYMNSFTTSSEIMLENNSISTFNSIENLFFVSFHGMKHYWFRQIWLTDAVALFDATKEEVLKEINSFDQKEIILFTLHFGYRKLNLKVPKEIDELFDIRFYNKELEALIKYSHCKYFTAYYQTKLIYRLIKGDKNKQMLRKQIKYYRPYKILLRLMKPNQRDYDFVKLSKCLFFLYFIVKPIRIIRRKLYNGLGN